MLVALVFDSAIAKCATAQTALGGVSSILEGSRRPIVFTESFDYEGPTGSTNPLIDSKPENIDIP